MFEKGHPKWGGRKKGAGKERYRVREMVEAVLGMPLPEKLLKLVKDKPMGEKEICLALMPYCYPKLNLNTNETMEPEPTELEEKEHKKLRADKIIELIKMP